MGASRSKPHADDSALSETTTATAMHTHDEKSATPRELESSHEKFLDSIPVERALEDLDAFSEEENILLISSVEVAIGARIGGGTFGQVYAGRVLATGEELAFKMFFGIPPKNQDRGVFNLRDWRENYLLTHRKPGTKVIELVRHFAQNTCHHSAISEIKTLVHLKGHPNIVSIHSVALMPNQGIGPYSHAAPVVEAWIAMERCSGSLMQLIVDQPKRKFTFGAIRSVFMQLLEGLAYVHSKGYVHRDIKSQNVLISEDGVVKIADFGSARKIPTPEENPQTYITTAPFRAPELTALVSHTYDEKIDVWSAGVVFFELLTRTRVFGDFDDPPQMLKAMFAMRGYPSPFALKELRGGRRSHFVEMALMYATCSPMAPRMYEKTAACHGGEAVQWMPLVDAAMSMLEYSSKERPSASEVLACVKASVAMDIKVSDVLDALVP